ncbi:MAG: D-3-phosphoglycerate dehydrogenase / 2-oxoglutarate reductase [Candidatus Eremiobacteraeota bacterium]|nr:D-3-phosphoglycerate dehydrogenase / 2-oxoglutarate reductase [Candidatus Eremiobacteraeota bacterium]
MSAHRNWRVVATARGFDGTPEAAALLRDAGCELVTTPYSAGRFDYELGGDELVALLAGADAYVAGSADVSRYVLERSPQLKVVSRRGVGFERIDLDAARERSVLVTIATGANQHAVADHVFALLLAVARDVVDANRSIVEGRWQSFIGPELRGKTLGIIGLGRVGKGVARRARGFAMNVIATDPVRDDEFARANDVTYVPLDELFARSDAVSVNASLNDTTRGLVGAPAFARMKDGAILINTARGGIVDEHALAGALRAGKLRGAGVDVFEREPPVGSPLIGLPNIVLTPHTAAYTHEAMTAANMLAAEIVVGYMHGRLPHPDCIVVAPATLKDRV